MTGIPRCTIRDWRHKGAPGSGSGLSPACPRCNLVSLNLPWYSYLLGLYLGDGCLSLMPRGVYKLRIALDIRYVNIIDECAHATRLMRPPPGTKVGFTHGLGYVEVSGHWKHWPCLFPQHAPGPKHLRTIELEPWQQEIAVAHPRRLLRGLIHSDGCRDKNVVLGKSYPRYSFSNESAGIRQIFMDVCDRLGIHWTRPREAVVAISRRADVAFMDTFIGPKT